MYLAIVMDLYSRKMIVWAMSKRMTVALMERAMQRAINLRNPGSALIFHSVRGSQYTRKRLSHLLKKIAYSSVYEWCGCLLG